ncbi:lipoprotein [Enterobacter kobei]|nr:lipoprotein [Enterobacter kobei]
MKRFISVALLAALLAGCAHVSEDNKVVHKALKL